MKNINERIFKNTNNTCIYIDGYENGNSIIKLKCIKHNIIFETKYENVKRENRPHLVCPICKAENIQNKYKNQQKLCICDYCNKEYTRAFSKAKKSKHGFNFCSRTCKDKAQQIESGDKFISMRPKHYNLDNNYRKKAFKYYEHKCAICDWNEDEDMLEVHHIDEDRSNNSINNLLILCSICHRKLTSHKYKLIGREQIILNIT